MNCDINIAEVVRFERKFLISSIDRFITEAILRMHPAAFSEIYHQRFVNNIYFDTINMDSFSDNIIGVSQRRKTRIRWYGPLTGKIEAANLEIKIKNNFLTTKRAIKLRSFNLSQDFFNKRIRECIFNQGIPELIRNELACLRPVLLNRYLRKYFLSRDGKFRVTMDTGQEFFKLHTFRNNFQYKSIDRTNIVLELKYSEEMDKVANKLTAFLPFRLTKSSKYVSGVNALYF